MLVEKRIIGLHLTTRLFYLDLEDCPQSVRVLPDGNVAFHEGSGPERISDLLIQAEAVIGFEVLWRKVDAGLVIQFRTDHQARRHLLGFTPDEPSLQAWATRVNQLYDPMKMIYRVARKLSTVRALCDFAQQHRSAAVSELLRGGIDFFMSDCLVDGRISQSQITSRCELGLHSRLTSEERLTPGICQALMNWIRVSKDGVMIGADIVSELRSQETAQISLPRDYVLRLLTAIGHRALKGDRAHFLNKPILLNQPFG